VIEVEGLFAPAAPDRGAPPEDRRPLLVEIRLEITELNQTDELTSSSRFEGFGEFRLCDPRSAFDARAAALRRHGRPGTGPLGPSCHNT
jgi:hypothetical protein